MEPFAFADKTQEYDGAQTVNCKSYFPTGTFYWDLKAAQNAEITLTSSVTMGAPLNWKKGRLVMLDVIQGGAGSFTLSWNAAFKSVSTLTLGTTAGSSNVLVFKCIDNGYVSLVSNSAMTRT